MNPAVRQIPKSVLALATRWAVEDQERHEFAARCAHEVRRLGGSGTDALKAFFRAGGRIGGAMGPEVKLVGSFPAVTPNTTQQLMLSGTLPDGYELRGLLVDLNMTYKSAAAGTFALAAADHNTTMSAFIQRLRMKAWGLDNCYQLAAPAGRSMAVYMQSADPFTTDPRLAVGHTVVGSAGAAEQTHMSWPIWFAKRGIDFPEIFAPSTNQFNVPGHTLTAQLGPGGSGVVLANGTANFTLASIDVYCVIAPATLAHFGPGMIWEEIAVTQNPFPTSGYFLDGFLADERDPYTVAGQVTSIQVTRDNRVSPANISPPVLAQSFLNDSETIDGARPYNLTAGPGGVASGQGSQLTPYSWLDGATRATEWQYPVTRNERAIYQVLAAGGSANATLLNWRVLPIKRVFDELVKTCSRHNVIINSVEELEVRGGGGADNDILSDFKGRRLTKKKVLSEAGKKAA
jgi:hypothetical protein